MYLFTYLHIHLFNQSIIHFNLNFLQLLLYFRIQSLVPYSAILHRVQYTPFKYIGNEAAATKTTTNAGWRSSRRRRNKLRLPRLI